MAHHLLPALFALFLWWASTGAVIFLDNLPPRTFRWTMLGATFLLAASVWGLGATASDTSVAGAYGAFASGLGAWVWHEVAFYTGWVTGPRKRACHAGCDGWAHFGHALAVSAWHELAILAGVAATVAATWGEPNQIGTWTFLILWWMHESARLNVFLGVRNVSAEILPAHLAYLRSFLKTRPMNLFFPISVSVSTIACAMLFEAAFAADASPFTAAGFMGLGVLMALAILEHWFLVLPLPAAKLWQWSLRSRDARRSFEAQILAG